MIRDLALPATTRLFPACYGEQMGSTYLEDAIRKLKEFEGSIDWMYLDTVGKVTVGVGLMLPTSEAAQALAFAAGDRAATSEEIAKEFERVAALARGRAATFYARKGGVRLPSELIAEKLRDTLTGFEGYLRRHLPGYDALPDVAKVALLDMVYNLGPGKLFSEYPQLIAAVSAGDWKRAAVHSQRRGPGADRNLWTREQFLLAGKTVKADLKAAAAGSRVTAWVLGAFAALVATVIALEIWDEAERR